MSRSAIIGASERVHRCGCVVVGHRRAIYARNVYRDHRCVFHACMSVGDHRRVFHACMSVGRVSACGTYATRHNDTMMTRRKRHIRGGWGVGVGTSPCMHTQRAHDARAAAYTIATIWDAPPSLPPTTNRVRMAQAQQSLVCSAGVTLLATLCDHRWRGCLARVGGPPRHSARVGRPSRQSALSRSSYSVVYSSWRGRTSSDGSGPRLH